MVSIIKTAASIVIQRAWRQKRQQKVRSKTLLESIHHTNIVVL
jgi:hypothetical protein